MNTAQQASIFKLKPEAGATDKPAPKSDSAMNIKNAMRFNNVSKTYDNGTTSLLDISFDIEAGSLVSVVGPSGCGKSTLLRLASGLESYTTGTMEVNQQSLGYVFQDATLLPWRTVLKNVELFAELHGVSTPQRRKLALAAIELVGLKGFEHHHPKSLSGGMRMRVSLARTLLLDPPICLFDEPFGALDEISRERLHDELLNIYQKAKFTGLFITHSIQEAVYLSSRILVMSERPGRIIGDFNVDLPYPRSQEIRFTPEYSNLCKQVQASLRGACK